MNAKSWILGAIPFALIAGAASGTAINTTPISGTHAHWLDNVPQHQISAAQNRAAERGQYDHYPLETPDGVVPVARLSDRGLYRDRATNGLAGYYRTDFDQPAVDGRPPHDGHSSVEPLHLEEPASISSDDAPDTPNPPVRLSVLESNGKARTIDVGAALASQQMAQPTELAKSPNWPN